MKGHRLRRIWMPMVIAVALVAGHGIIVYFFSSHLALSTAVVFAAVVSLVIKRWGSTCRVGLLNRVNALKTTEN